MGTGASTAAPANISTASTTSGRQASTHSETRSALVGWACVDGKASWSAGSRRPWRRAGWPLWAWSGAYWRPTRRRSSICWSTTTSRPLEGHAITAVGWAWKVIRARYAATPLARLSTLSRRWWPPSSRPAGASSTFTGHRPVAPRRRSLLAISSGAAGSPRRRRQPSPGVKCRPVTP